jgi:uncharacterized membrane protein
MKGFGMVGRALAAHPRLFIGIACGCALYAVLPVTLAAQTRAIIAWDAGAALYLALAFVLFVTTPIERIAVDAERQAEGEWTIFGVTVAGIVFSFIALISEFSGMKDLGKNERGLHVALVVATLFVSWLMAQTTFALRYAHEYYEQVSGRSDVKGGLEFPGEKRPDYLDFAYFALVIGMTFQVSDVQVTSRQLRRVVALQGFLSFVFNTVILALTVNIAASML